MWMEVFGVGVGTGETMVGMVGIMETGEIAPLITREQLCLAYSWFSKCGPLSSSNSSPGNLLVADSHAPTESKLWR